MSNKLKYFVIAALLVFFIAGLMITVASFGDTYSWYENRSLNSMPEITLEGVMDGTYFSNLEKFLVDRSAGRNVLLGIKAVSDNAVFNRPNVNGIVTSEDVLLMYRDYIYSNHTTYQASYYAEKMSKLNALITSYGGYFCYVGVPNQYNFYDGLYPYYLENMADETDAVNAEFTSLAESLGIPYLDMGPIMESAENSDELFFKTDHHYTLRGAYLTYTTLIDKINSDCRVELDYPIEEIGEITFNEVPNTYVGSHSRKIFNQTNVTEHLLKATFSENITFTRYDYGYETEAHVYSEPADTGVDLLYTYYMGGDIAHTVIDTNRDELPSILIYGDSFTNALECIAYYSFNEMHSIDLRYYNEMSLADYIELYKPDYVICIRDYDNLVMPYLNGDVFGELKN